MRSRLSAAPHRLRFLLLAGVAGALLGPGPIQAADRTVLGELYSAEL